jgi:hypothetical protein
MRILRCLTIGIAVNVLAVIAAVWWLPGIIQTALSTTRIDTNRYTLEVNTAGVCGAWHVKPSPSLGPLKEDVNVRAMDALSGGDIWIVGEVYGVPDLDDKQSRDLLTVHLGKSTSRAYSLQAPLSYAFSTVEMLAPHDVWASGPDTPAGSLPQLAHWDGSSWSIVPIRVPDGAASPSITSPTFFDFTALATGEFWIDGTVYPYSPTGKRKNLVFRRNGETWEQVPIPEVEALGQMLAVSSNDIWIDGWEAMLHWNGQEWSKLTRPEGRIWDMAASAADDVWAVGTEYREHEVYGNIITLHWDGRIWTSVPAPEIPVPANFLSAHRFELRGVTAISKEDAWAVGYLIGETSAFYEQQTIAIHWDGTTWSLIPSPNFSGSQSLSDVVAVSPNEVWTAGQVGPDIDERSILLAQFVRSDCSDVKTPE